MSCNEHDLSKIARISAAPKGDITYSHPVYIWHPVLSLGTYRIPDTLIRIPFLRKNLSLDDKENIGVGGRIHTVTLDFEIECTSESGYSLLETLRRPHELVIDYFGGVRKVVLTDATAYRFTSSDKDGRMRCTMTLVNGTGLTLLQQPSV